MSASIVIAVLYSAPLETSVNILILEKSFVFEANM